jgi:zinc transport system substrate-binding protein
MHIRFPLILAVLIAVVGCRPGSNEPADGRPVVYTSFYPLYDFAQKIGGDKVQVRCLIRPGTKAHDWEPSPRDLADLSKADLFLGNGLVM